MNHFADPRVEWRISEIEQSLRGKADRHEVSTINDNVDRLEHSNREICAEVFELRSQLQMLTDQVAKMMDQLAEMTESKS